MISPRERYPIRQDVSSAKVAPPLDLLQKFQAFTVTLHHPPEILRPGEVRKPEIPDEVLERAVNGDMRSLGQVYEMYEKRVVGYLRWRVPQDDVEDLSQAVWERVCRKMSNYQMIGIPFSHYLFVAARHICFDYYRRMKLERQHITYASSFASSTSRDPFTSPELVAENAEMSAILSEEISHLPRLQSQVLTFRYGSDLTVAQTAQVLGKTENNVKVTAHNGIKSLRRKLQESGIAKTIPAR